MKGREGDSYQWTGIAGAQKTSDVAIGHVNLLLDYLLPLSLYHSSLCPVYTFGLWQCISITRTSEPAADACDSCPKPKRLTTSLQHVPHSGATKLAQQERSRGEEGGGSTLRLTGAKVNYGQSVKPKSNQVQQTLEPRLTQRILETLFERRQGVTACHRRTHPTRRDAS